MKRDCQQLETDDADSLTNFDQCIERQHGQESTENKKRRMVIEKKRRDRINRYLKELSQLVPAAAEKAEASKIEKAEILEMTVEYVRSLSERKGSNLQDDNNNVSSTTRSDLRRLTEREAGFWSCASQIQQFLEQNYHGDEQGNFLPGLSRHLHEYATNKLPKVPDIKYPFGNSYNTSPNPFQHLDGKHQMIFKKICMDFLKNNSPLNNQPLAATQPTTFVQSQPVYVDPNNNQSTFQYDVLIPSTQSYQMFPINEFSP